jgi:endonuclease/exonuclease/phosphatase family metal-dependent hydrolase
MKFLFVMLCGISLQWPLVNESHPFIRLDFILVSPAILQGAHAAAASARPAAGSASDSNSGSAVEGLRAGVDRSNITEVLSDHFPVFAAWRDPSRPTIPLY